MSKNKAVNEAKTIRLEEPDILPYRIFIQPDQFVLVKHESESSPKYFVTFDALLRKLARLLLAEHGRENTTVEKYLKDYADVNKTLISLYKDLNINEQWKAMKNTQQNSH